MNTHRFPPTRTAALEHLAAFLPKTGAIYAAQRNYDLGSEQHVGVSQLSPYIRHRILPETEVLQATLGRFSPSTAEKFVQEVLWRTYWKGWLEQRPSVWDDYRQGLHQRLNDIQTQSGQRKAWEQACHGNSGIDCFDHWAQELVQTGYLHNHARMWFASIWIFTLRLPWELGADFFMRHLMDGDPASNTLGWRWVAGLQTVGRTYLARPDNIAKYTNGRFRPEGLAREAIALEGTPHPTISQLAPQQRPDSTLKTGLLITEEDMHPTHVTKAIGTPVAVAGLLCTHGRSDLLVSDIVKDFVADSLQNSLERMTPSGQKSSTHSDVDSVVDWAKTHELQQVVTAYAPVGPTAKALRTLRGKLDDSNIRLVAQQRQLDVVAWPHATKGFFAFKKNIPSILNDLQGSSGN
jgi:deoxyribodipyrimidine photo-lyase